MQVGALGDVVFQVTDETIETVTNMTWSGAVRYGTHQRHLTDALTEFTGIDPDTITFDIYLSSHLGVTPMEEMVKIWDHERNGDILPLNLGSKGYGKYRWNIKSHKIKMETFDGRGNVTSATVSISLQEYLKR